jgi:metal-responsive CopG/Arc/MetJ family transcriptional regulator
MTEKASKRLVVQAPPKMLAAIARAANHDYSSVSDFVRKAIASDLRQRGELRDDDDSATA